jgi:hypothetical protein
MIILIFFFSLYLFSITYLPFVTISYIAYSTYIVEYKKQKLLNVFQ